MPAIVLKQSAPAGKVSFKKDVDQVKPWSGESEIPDKMVWFKEVLDVDENGEITYLEDERGNGNEKENGTVMRTMRMSLISTCTSRRS